MFAYTVRCRIDDPEVAREWVAWVRDEHLRDVLEAGAASAEVVRLDPPAREPDAAPPGAPAGSVTCEVRYRFASRAAFERYERDHAPRLRAEGLSRFPLKRGLAYERTTGEILDRR